MFKKIVVVFFVLLILESGLLKTVYGYNKYIVNPNRVYTYEILCSDLKELSETYPGVVRYITIGKTLYNRQIWAVKLGRGESMVFFNGSHHANEWLTTNLIMYMIDTYCQFYINEQKLGEYDVREVLDNTSIWFVPMVNPDGVTLQQQGLQGFPADSRDFLIKLNMGSTDFKRWKSNAQGIDLNRQYPAGWEDIKINSLVPSFKEHKGFFPLVASEAKAVADFTNNIDPEITVSYHSSGRVIYWNFHNREENVKRDYKIASKFSDITGYGLVSPEANPDGGGYKDWFIQKFNRPGFTPEIGIYTPDINLPVSMFFDEWQRNKKVGLFIALEGYKLWNKRNRINPDKVKLLYD